MLFYHKDAIFFMPSHTLHDCSRALAAKKMTIAFAESATAGRMSAEFSLLPESGKILKGGLVCYDAEVKVNVLKIDRGIIRRYTPESAEVTELLALRLHSLIPSDVQVAITGLTTPGGSESPDKPVGTCFIHIIVRGKPCSIRQTFSGGPEQIVLQAIDCAAEKIIEIINTAG